MNEPNQPDDLSAYMDTLTDTEREEIEIAETAIDIAILLYRAREQRGLSQSAAAERAGLAQQAVSRLERPHPNVRIDTLRRYLGALGYDIDISIKDARTGEPAATISLPALRSA